MPRRPSAGDEAPTGSHEARPVTIGAALTVAVLAVLTVVGALLLVPLGGIHVGAVLAVISVLLVVGVFLGVRALARQGRDPARGSDPGPPS